MAGKSTISITFKLDGDGKSFKDLANSADGFKGVIQATITESEQLKKSLINWSQGVQAISAITNTISSISSAFSSLSEKMKGLQQENILTTQLTGKTGEEMLKLRNSVKATADHFGTDFTETMQAVNALAKGFGITTEEAMKLMQDGFVSGANANGEFVDTLKEYPRYFKEAGLSAEEFIAITTNAAQQGIYSDKGVDVIKEGNLRIREMTKATAEALQGIGISAEKVQADLQNGSLTTFDVMQLVAGKLNELPANSAAVGAAIADIFGGPGEDAGLEYIKTLSTIQLNMDTVKAAAGSTAEQQERQIRIQENLKNSLSGLIDLSAIYSNVQPYVELAAQAGTAAMGIGALVKTIKAMNVQQAITAARTAAVTVAQKAATAATTVWTGVQKILNLVLTANPIGLIVTAIGALVAAVIAAYKNCDGFRKICDKVWGAIKPLANAIMNGLAKAFEWLVEKCKEAWEWLKNILGLGGKK
ncbi:MAG: phage tail tape measure protein, partial [Clostridia bacterium]|nr:phage tail tape measure protein [Clostridia bacterium]